MIPILSILTPAIWSREQMASSLAETIKAQSANHPGSVEHLVLFDDRSRSVGLKRQALLDSARGLYIAFVDDDDDISPGYVEAILAEAVHGPDVITFEQRAIVNGAEGVIRFDANAQGDNPFTPGQTVVRPPWHVCAWRREVVAECVFPDSSYGEDLVWSLQARLRMLTTRHIPRVLHTYRHSWETTAAPPPTH